MTEERLEAYRLGWQDRDAQRDFGTSLTPTDPLPPRILPATQVGIYDRNRRTGVPAGTKFAIVIVRFDPKRDSTDARRRAGSEALGMAIKAYENTHGPVAWDLAQVVTTHLTGKIAVELRVSP